MHHINGWWSCFRQLIKHLMLLKATEEAPVKLYNLHLFYLSLLCTLFACYNVGNITIKNQISNWFFSHKFILLHPGSERSIERTTQKMKIYSCFQLSSELLCVWWVSEKFWIQNTDNNNTTGHFLNSSLVKLLNIKITFLRTKQSLCNFFFL